MKRRQFIATTFTAAVAVAQSPMLFAASRKEIGLQLYTLRNIIASNVKGTLEKVAGIGFTTIEPYGYNEGMIFGMTYPSFVGLAKSIGLRVPSCHGYSINNLTFDEAWYSQWEKAFQEAAALEQPYFVIPSVNGSGLLKADDIRKLCEAINTLGAKSKALGVRLGYHNHNSEFKTLDDGQVIYDIMLKELDPSFVAMQMDIGWVAAAKKDPLEYFKKYPGRFESWHVKDLDKVNPPSNVDVGTGSVDFKSIFRKWKKSGLQYFFLEQENFSGDPFEGLTNGFKYISTIV